MIRPQSSSVWVGGLDLGRWCGFALDPASASPFDVPAQDLPSLAIPGAAGVLFPGTAPTVGAKTITIVGALVTDSLADATQAAQVMKERASAGLVALTFSAAPTRAWYGVLQSFTCSYPSYASANGVARVAMTFLCPFPYAAELAGEIVSFGATPVAVPLGTAPSVGRDGWGAVIEVTGAATTPAVTYADAAGNALATMAFTYSPAAGDTLRIDLARRLIQRRVSGTWSSDGFAYLSAGYTWPALDPADGVISDGAYPRLSVSSGSGLLSYRRCYR